MVLFDPYKFKREIDKASPLLAFILIAMATEDAVDQRSLKPLTGRAGDLMEGIFG